MTTAVPQTPSPSLSRGRASRVVWIVALAVLLWFAASEVATYAWYSSQEAKLQRNQLPPNPEVLMSRLTDFVSEDGTSPTRQNIGAAATDILKCAYGETLYWPSEGQMEAVTVLKWREGSVVGGVEALHNPGICLRAAGWQVGAETDFGEQNFEGALCKVTQWQVSRPNLDMFAFSAVFRRFVDSTTSVTVPFWNSDRLRSVFAGRRDAPVYIVLAYLPVDEAGESAVRARFDELMRVMFRDAGSPATL